MDVSHLSGRLIHQAGLREISIVSSGAYPTSRVAAGALPITRMEAERREARVDG